MRKNELCYRGISCKRDEMGKSITIFGDAFSLRLLRIRDRLNAEELLDDEMINNISKGAEMYMKLKSKGKTISYLMGEMILINGKWSLFTSPNVDYSVSE